MSFDDNEDPDTHYGKVVMRVNDTWKRLYDKVNTEAQVNIPNYNTFKELYGDEADQLLKPSNMKFAGNGETMENSKHCRLSTTMSL